MLTCSRHLIRYTRFSMRTNHHTLKLTQQKYINAKPNIF